MQCEARHREGKGQPWVQCTARADVVLLHHTQAKVYCRQDADRFIETFPRGTFTTYAIGRGDG